MSDKSFYKNMEWNYGITCRHACKQYHSNLNCTVRAIASKRFLIRCRKERITPRFILDQTKRLFDVKTSRIKHFEDRTGRKMLSLQIENVMRKIKNLRNKSTFFRNKMYQLAPQHVINKFIHQLKMNSLSYGGTIMRKHEVKFNKLVKQQSPPIKYNPLWFKNLTGKAIPEDVQMILSFGPKFAVYQNPKDVPINNIIADVEEVVKTVDNMDEHNTIKGKAATIISNHLHKTNSFKSRRQVVLYNAYQKTKQYLKSNPDITITQADKGNITIAMLQNDYHSILNEYFEDKNKFYKLVNDPTKQLQLKNNELIRDMFDQKCIDKRTKNQLLTFVAQSPRPRATPKIHKPGARIIVNATNSPSYELARFLKNVLTKANIVGCYNIRNSVELKRKLDGVIIENDELLVSFDIVSMFEKIPISSVLRSVEKRWDSIASVTPIPLNMFMKLLRFCVQESNYVCYNNKFYKQRDGLTIGGSVSAILADYVVTDLMDRAFYESAVEPSLCVKYVDDTLVILKKEDVESVFTALNRDTPTVKFTYEVECEGVIPYLDMLIHRTKSRKIETSYYQKPTSMNRLLNYESTHPLMQRRSIVYGTISRILSITSITYEQDSVNTIYNILQMNSYPKKMIKQLLLRYQNNLHRPNEVTKEHKAETMYKSLTYTQHLSEKLNGLFKVHNKLIRIGYRPYSTTRTIMYPQPTTSLEVGEKHGVVYAFDCNDCDGKYIGQTRQKLMNRVKQHENDQRRCTKLKNHTAAVQHILDTGHTFRYNGTKILASEPHLGKRLTIEAIHININKTTTVNLKSDMDNLNPAYIQILEHHHKLKKQIT